MMSATWLTHLEHQWRSLAWRPWLDAFSRGRNLLRYDARGCGLSDRDTSDLSFDNWVSDFECVIDAAAFGRFDLLATCWGGPIAITYAARHPERVNRLILYGTYAVGECSSIRKLPSVEDKLTCRAPPRKRAVSDDGTSAAHPNTGQRCCPPSATCPAISTFMSSWTTTARTRPSSFATGSPVRSRDSLTLPATQSRTWVEELAQCRASSRLSKICRMRKELQSCWD